MLGHHHWTMDVYFQTRYKLRLLVNIKLKLGIIITVFTFPSNIGPCTNAEQLGLSHLFSNLPMPSKVYTCKVLAESRHFHLITQFSIRVNVFVHIKILLLLHCKLLVKPNLDFKDQTSSFEL